MRAPEGRRASAPGRVRRLVAAHTDAAAVRAARAAVYRATAVLHTENHDPRANGEERVLRRLGPGARVVFDVGAHHGDWAALALRACPEATVHCFEIAAPARAVLHARLGPHPRVRIADHGLLDVTGDVAVKEYAGDDRLSSVLDYPHAQAHTWRTEPVTTGEAYMKAAGIDHIDLLKLDAEGAELRVLQGFGTAADIDAIQFEYGFGAVLSGALLARFHELLEPRGYVIGRVLPGRVDFTPYRLSDERFFGPNFVAVRPELVARLR